MGPVTRVIRYLFFNGFKHLRKDFLPLGEKTRYKITITGINSALNFVPSANVKKKKVNSNSFQLANLIERYPKIKVVAKKAASGGSFILKCDSEKNTGYVVKLRKLINPAKFPKVEIAIKTVTKTNKEELIMLKTW
jgi:hypothetical protein